jgi:hypothetical protein
MFNIFKNCSECEQELIDNSIKYIGNRTNYYFCSNNCHDTFKKNKLCQICHERYNKMEMIDGCAICFSEEIPTCKQQYTGLFICDFCDKEKTGTIYCIENDDTIYSDDEWNYIKNKLAMCEECFKSCRTCKTCENNVSYLYSLNYYLENCKSNYRKMKNGDIYYIDSRYSYYNIIVNKHKDKIFFIDTTKKEIAKLINNEQIDEVKELYNYIGELLNENKEE